MASSGDGFERLSTLAIDDGAGLPMHDDPAQTLGARHGIGALSVHALAQTTDGQFVLGGTAEDTTSGRSRAWLGKLDHDSRGVRLSLWLDDARCVATNVVRLRSLSDGNLLVVASNCLYKVDPSGQVLSVIAAAGTTPTTTAEAQSIRATPDGGFLVGATLSGGSWILRLDEAGTIRWQRKLPGLTLTDIELAGEALPGSADIGFVVAAWTTPGTSQTLTRFDPNANVEWQQAYEGMAATRVRRTADGDSRSPASRRSLVSTPPVCRSGFDASTNW